MAGRRTGGLAEAAGWAVCSPPLVALQGRSEFFTLELQQKVEVQGWKPLERAEGLENITRLRKHEQQMRDSSRLLRPGVGNRVPAVSHFVVNSQWVSPLWGHGALLSREIS